MPFPAAAVANEFLTIAKDSGEKLTPMKLQKLVYFAHGWFLALTGEPLVSERVEAWQYGPVIPRLYGYFKGYGNTPIESLMTEERVVFPRFGFVIPRIGDYATVSPSLTSQAVQVIRKVWDEYGKFSPARLSNATHAPGSPWERVYKEGTRGTIIPDEAIKNYFRELAHASA